MEIANSILIHFICTGNIYRSRLAEAYLKSKNISLLSVSSSGTQASLQHKGPISWYALRLLYRNNLLPYMNPTWKETTKEDIITADAAIFIGKNSFEFCKSQFPLPKRYEVWDLPDFDDRNLNGKQLDLKIEAAYIKISEDVFAQIREKVDALVKNLLLV